jgi:hypothetical protein
MELEIRQAELARTPHTGAARERVIKTTGGHLSVCECIRDLRIEVIEPL